jgi:hypothetical protein
MKTRSTDPTHCTPHTTHTPPSHLLPRSGAQPRRARHHRVLPARAPQEGPQQAAPLEQPGQDVTRQRRVHHRHGVHTGYPGPLLCGLPGRPRGSRLQRVASHGRGQAALRTQARGHGQGTQTPGAELQARGRAQQGETVQPQGEVPRGEVGEGEGGGRRTLVRHTSTDKHGRGRTRTGGDTEGQLG